MTIVSPPPDSSRPASDAPTAPRSSGAVRRRRAEGAAKPVTPNRPPAPVSSPGLSAGLAQTYLLIMTAAALAFSLALDTTAVPAILTLTGVWLVLTVVVRPGVSAASRGLLITVTIGLLIRHYGGMEAEGVLWGVGTLLVLAIPFATRPLKKVGGFPFLHIWCVVEGIYIYVATFVARPPIIYRYLFTPDVRTLGMKAAFIFTACLVGTGTLVMALFGRTDRSRPVAEPARLQRGWATRAYGVIGVSMLVLGAAYVAGAYQALGSLVGALQFAAFGGWLLLVIVWMDGHLRFYHKIVVGLALVPWALVTLSGGALYQVAYPGFFLLALWMARKRYVPWLPIIGALALLLMVNSTKAQFRDDAREGRISTTGVDAGLNWLERTRDNLDETTEEQIETSAWRFSNTDVLGYVDKWVPERFDFFGYDPYTSLPVVMIPRVIMPEKPAINFENEFGRRYELIGRADYNTTINTPLHAEAMVVGGLPVLVTVGLLVGAFFGFLTLAFRSPQAPTLMTGSVVTLQLVLSVESGVLPLVLIVPYALVLWPLFWWVCNGGASLRRAVSQARLGEVGDDAVTPPPTRPAGRSGRRSPPS